MSNTPPGTRWQLGEYGSPARLDRKTFLHDTAVNLDALSPIYPNMAVIPTTSNTNWTKDQIYIRNSDNTQWLGGGSGKHLHNADTDAAGGLFRDIIFANLQDIYWENLINPTAADFQKEGNGGTITDNPANFRVVFSSGAVNAQYVSGGKSGTGVSFASKSKFIIKMNVNAPNQLTARVGVCGERVDAAVGGDTVQKYGLEVCDSAGTAMDWSMFTANGSSTRGTVTATGQSVAPGSVKSYKLIYTPATNVKLFVNAADTTTPATTLSTGVPGGGSVSGFRNIGIGIRANTTAIRELYLSGLAFVGRIGDTAFQ